MHIVDLQFAYTVPIKRNIYTRKVFWDHIDKGKLKYQDLFHNKKLVSS